MSKKIASTPIYKWSGQKASNLRSKIMSMFREENVDPNSPAFRYMSRMSGLPLIAMFMFFVCAEAKVLTSSVNNILYIPYLVFAAFIYKAIYRKKPISVSLLKTLALFALIVAALACDSGASFTGTIDNCDSQGVCHVQAATSGVINFVGQETCLNFVDNNSNGIMQLKVEVVSIYFNMIYSLVYYTGDRTVVGYGQSHCIGIGHCPSNCNTTSYPDRTNDGMFTSPYIALTKGELTCYRYDISGFCPFPGDDCQYCGYYVLPQGEPKRVYEYNSASLPNILTKLTFVNEGGQFYEDYVPFIKGIDQIHCFGTVCFNFNFLTDSDFEFDPKIQYSSFPGYVTGSSDIFSLPGFPIVNKIGDVQSSSPSPWSSTDYSNIVYTHSIVNQQPTLDGCTTSTVSSRLNSANTQLPFFQHGTYYEAIDPDNFSGIRAHKANTTSTLYTIQTTTNSTIVRTVTSNMFTVAPQATFSGCCDCSTGARMCFFTTMTDLFGTGTVESEDIIFLDPVFRVAQNCLTFHTNKCTMNNHRFTFRTNSMSSDYDFDVILNHVDIPQFSSIHYTTIDINDSSFTSENDNNMDVGGFLSNLFGFKNNNLSTIFSSLLIAFVCLCLVLLFSFCFMQCCLQFIKQKAN